MLKVFHERTKANQIIDDDNIYYHKYKYHLILGDKDSFDGYKVFYSFFWLTFSSYFNLYTIK